MPDRDADASWDLEIHDAEFVDAERQDVGTQALGVERHHRDELTGNDAEVDGDQANRWDDPRRAFDDLPDGAKDEEE